MSPQCNLRHLALTTPSRFSHFFRLAPGRPSTEGDTPRLAQNSAICVQSCRNQALTYHATWRPTGGTHNTLTLLGLLWNCRLVGLRLADAPALAQHTAICIQLCWDHLLTSHAAQRPTCGTHNTLTLSAPLWNCRLGGLQLADPPPLAQNTAICTQFCNNQSLTPPAARRPTRGTHNTLTLSEPLWNRRPVGIPLAGPPGRLGPSLPEPPLGQLPFCKKACSTQT